MLKKVSLDQFTPATVAELLRINEKS